MSCVEDVVASVISDMVCSSVKNLIRRAELSVFRKTEAISGTFVVRIAPSDCIRRMLTRRTRGAHAEAWKAGRNHACRNASMNVNVFGGADYAIKENGIKR
jgi:hypothetical protein